MSSEQQRDLELTRALLAQARADRDRLQEHLLALEDNVRWLRRLPLLRPINHARRRLGARRTQRAAPPPPPVSGPVRPGRYLDVTVLRDPARTGIARVTLRLARELGYGLVTLRDGALRHDDEFLVEVWGGERSNPGPVAGTPLVPGPGVVVLNTAIQLGSDFHEWQEAIARLRRAGGSYVQIVHDLLPEELPDFFDYGMRHRFPQWLEVVARSADLILTDSAATATSLTGWLAHRHLPAPPIRPWPLGCDPLPSATAPESTTDTPTVNLLAVGTIEPRKAYDVVIAAAEVLRARGVPVHLTIVGAQGWVDQAFIDHVIALDRQPWFTWLPRASDAELADAYAAADLLVAASRGEGFGLPIVEARAAGTRVVARDLPVFRELLGPEGHYFETDDSLAHAIETALAAPPGAEASALTTWHEAAAEVDRAITAMAATPGV